MAGNNGSKSIQEAVYNELKQGIMTLRLAPGSAMSTQEMALRLNVSRTPVREAFLSLQREGLVEAIPQRETIVSRIDPKRAEQECFIRESLERAAVQPFIAMAKEEDYLRLRKNIETQYSLCNAQNWLEFVDCDTQFHKIFFDVTQQSLAWNVILNNNGHYNRIRLLTVQNTDTMRDSILQHTHLVDLLEQGKAAEAEDAFLHHIRGANFQNRELESKFRDYFSGSGTQTQGIHIRPL